MSTTSHGHRERLRSRFQDGPERLADYEILELLLGYVMIRRDTKPAAKALLDRFSSIRGVLEASPEELTEVADVGPGTAIFLQILREFMARVAESPIKERTLLCSPEEVARMAQKRLATLPHEEMWVAYVDNKNGLIKWEKAAQGTVNATSVFPREIIRRALEVKAAAFVLVHNHPGGSHMPSRMDLTLTDRIKHAAQAVDIWLVDHIIITRKVCYSILSNSIVL